MVKDRSKIFHRCTVTGVSFIVYLISCAIRLANNIQHKVNNKISNKQISKLCMHAIVNE